MKNKLTKLWSKLNLMMISMGLLGSRALTMASATSAQTAGSFMNKFQSLIDEYSTELTIVMSVAMLVSIVIFIYHCVQLNLTADNPQGRKTAITNLLITGFCLAAQGALSTILAIIYYAFG